MERLIRFRLMPRADHRTFFRLFAACWFTFALAACEGETSDPDSTPTPASPAGLRIVSLSPALTRIAADLGLAGAIVGRTQFCTAIQSSVPVVGDHFTQNLELLVRLRPTHILLQPPRNEPPIALRDLAEQHDWTLLHWRIDTIDDVRAIVREMPEMLNSIDASARQLLQQRSHALIDEIDAALAPGPAPLRPAQSMRVLMVYSTDPSISVFGSDTYLDEVLRAFGCANAAGHLSGWGQISLEDALRLDADAIIIISQRHGDLTEAMGSLAATPLRASAEGRIAMLVHPEALLPSTSVIEVAGELRAILDSFAEPRP